MYFYKKNGKQHIDFRGDLILTHNDELVKTRVKSAAPRYAHNARYSKSCHRLGFFRKCALVLRVIGFIWGPDTSLKRKTIKGEEL